MSLFKRPVPTVDSEPTTMTDEERQRLVRSWPAIACVACGDYHPGLCSRIEEISYHPNGKVMKIKVRAASEWRDMPDTIKQSDVFEGAAVEEVPESPLQGVMRRIS